MADTTLVAMRKLVRQYTHSFSPDQISDAEIDEKINIFVLYDLPNHVRLFSLRTTFEFFTQPNRGTYQTTDVDPNDPLYNFKNKYIVIHKPAFIAGVQAFYSQWPDSFYAQWPLTNSIANTYIVGNGTTGPYTAILNAKPIMQDYVIFTAVDVNGTSMILVDYPINNVTGYLAPPNNPQVGPSPYGTINYITGAFTATFPNNVPLNTQITAETIPYSPGKPNSILYYNNIFTIRPIPDKVYSVTVEADIRPTELLANNASPELEQWFQWIAVEASIKILQPRMDMKSVELLEQLRRLQMNLTNRSTLLQATEKQSQTIYDNRNSGNGYLNNPQWPY